MTTKTRVVHSDLEILGGTPIFLGTRVPVKTLLDCLEAGDSLGEFLDHFPSVKREPAIAALELSDRLLDLGVIIIRIGRLACLLRHFTSCRNPSLYDTVDPRSTFCHSPHPRAV